MTLLVSLHTQNGLTPWGQAVCSTGGDCPLQGDVNSPRGDIVPPLGNILPTGANLFPAGGDLPASPRGALPVPLWETASSCPRGFLPTRGKLLTAQRNVVPPRQDLVSKSGDISATRGEPAWRDKKASCQNVKLA